MPLPRFRIRTLMIAVAVVGVTLVIAPEASRLWRLSGLYRNRASDFASSEKQVRGIARRFEALAQKALVQAKTYRSGRVPDDEDPDTKKTLQDFREAMKTMDATSAEDPLDVGAGLMDEAVEQYTEEVKNCDMAATYFGNMRRKYERAARYPWLSVPPDPPQPK
jgi:hypothetical protein